MAIPQEDGWRPAEDFGTRLLLVRRELGLTQAQAAERCGLSAATWNTWEHGASPRGLDTIVATIAKALGVNRDWLMWGSTAARMYAPLVGLPSKFDGRSRPNGLRPILNLLPPVTDGE